MVALNIELETDKPLSYHNHTKQTKRLTCKSRAFNPYIAQRKENRPGEQYIDTNPKSTPSTYGIEHRGHEIKSL